MRLRRHWRSLGLGALFAAQLLGACTKLEPATPRDQARERSLQRSPLSQAERPTLEGKTYLARLDEQIAGYERALEDGEDLDVLHKLGNAYLLRGSVLGKITDLERSIEMTERAMKLNPADPPAFVYRGQVETELRRFDAAERYLAEGERKGGANSSTRGTRARLYRHQGRHGEALVLLTEHNATAPTLYGMGNEAATRAALGEYDAAELLFVRAQHQSGGDLAPVTLTWLYHQEALMWLKRGETKRAIELLEAGYERFPLYARSTALLGALLGSLGRFDEARARLKPVAETSEDPEAAGILARVLEASGRPIDAERWRTLADARFTELVAVYPEAFSQKAAEFWMRTARDAKKAAPAAVRAFELFGTPETLELALESTLSAGELERACKLVPRALAMGQRLTAQGRALSDTAASRCTP
ncbi:tetratricopeptide repeat protein [Myxococcota bacterium]|nr:tetratricopeptide repeat protein [Myxococcota bacterium]